MSLRGRWFLILVLMFATSPACATDIAGQRLPAHRFKPALDAFDTPDNVATLHYYGSGGWGILWRGVYIMTAPYFSNHPLSALLLNQLVPPQLDLIEAGFKNTPAKRAALILVGHGHIDHAGDIGGFFEAGLPRGKVGLVADASVVDMLGSTREQFRCRVALGADDDGKPLESNTAANKACIPTAFRITPLHSGHAPHAHLLGLNIEAFGGRVSAPRGEPPRSANDYKLGYPHAYLIDLVDAKGKVAFRIHYMDAASEPPHALIDLKAQTDPRDVDLHIGCAAGYDMVTDYPEAVVASTRVHFVLAAHWENFFKEPTARLALVPSILNEKKMNALIKRIEAAIKPDTPKLSPLDLCDATHPCGPRGERWAVPIPRETLHFHTQ